MKKIKIETVPMPKRDYDSSTVEQFLEAIRDIEEGESFVIQYFPSNYRIILSAMPVLLGKRFTTRKTDKGSRVICIEVFEI